MALTSELTFTHGLVKFLDEHNESLFLDKRLHEPML